jgi:tRNA A37 methylthiotransferase MiaB
VETPEEAGYVFYNTCSIRDKAEQKVFNRLQHFKRQAGKGKVFAVIGCVAQQEGEKIFERAPHVSLVAGSASYTKLPEMLVQLEAGNKRVTGLSLDTTEPSIRRSRAATIRTALHHDHRRLRQEAAPTAWCRSRAVRSAAAPAPA